MYIIAKRGFLSEKKVSIIVYLRFWGLNMKILRFLIACLLVAVLSACFSSPSSRTHVPEPPRREFQAIEPGVFPSHEPSIVGDFVADNNSFR